MSGIPLRSAKRLVAFLVFVVLLAGPFRAGWAHLETDFPNYYTAASLVRHAEPLRAYYDWTWFARKMSYAGIDHQLGAYTPQTPMTMLPFVPLTWFSPQKAKQIWLMLNLVFLGLTIWLLSLMTRFSFEEISLLTFCGYFSLHTNFLHGQYYVFLLFLLTLTFYFLHRKNHLLGGAVTGIAFALKLYGGPFLLYFAARREWKALIYMVLVTLLLVCAAIVLFGPRDVYYYATQILPRTLEGGSIDPYAPGVPTYSTLLRHLLVREPELNPLPFHEAPWIFFFLRTVISLAIITLLLLCSSMRCTMENRDFAWFMIAVLLLSTSTASYTFILLLLPIVLLLNESGPWQSLFLVASYVLLTFPLRPTWLFPKVWMLFALFVCVGWPRLRQVPRSRVLAVLLLTSTVAFLDAKRHMLSYVNEAGQRFERVAVQKGAVFSSFPVVSRAGIFYQSMGHDRYVLHWLHDNRDEELLFDGQALHPRSAPDGESIYFELVANRASTMMHFDPATRKATPRAMPVPGDSIASVVSPNGHWIAYESAHNGPVQIWLRNLSSGRERRLTGGNCNNSSPAWELDSRSILFASDCGRAFGLPALYRARIEPEN
jgi:Glycosyltransferase family 87